MSTLARRLGHHFHGQTRGHEGPLVFSHAPAVKGPDRDFGMLAFLCMLPLTKYSPTVTVMSTGDMSVKKGRLASDLSISFSFVGLPTSALLGSSSRGHWWPHIVPAEEDQVMASLMGPCTCAARSDMTWATNASSRPADHRTLWSGGLRYDERPAVACLVCLVPSPHSLSYMPPEGAHAPPLISRFARVCNPFHVGSLRRAG